MLGCRTNRLYLVRDRSTDRLSRFTSARTSAPGGRHRTSSSRRRTRARGAHGATRARLDSGLGHAATDIREAHPDEFLHERPWQGTVNREVQRTLGHRVALKLIAKLPKHRAAEREVAQVVLECGKASDGLATHPEGGNAIGDH